MHKFFIAYWVNTSWRYLVLSLIENTRITRCFLKAAFYMRSIWNRKDKQTKRRSMETKVESMCQSSGLWNSVAHPYVQFTGSDQSSKYYRDFHSQPAGGVILIATLYIHTMLTGNGHYDTWRRIMRLSLDLSLQITHPPQGKLATPLGSMSPSVFSYSGLVFYVPQRTR